MQAARSALDEAVRAAQAAAQAAIQAAQAAQAAAEAAAAQALAEAARIRSQSALTTAENYQSQQDAALGRLQPRTSDGNAQTPPVARMPYDATGPINVTHVEVTDGVGFLGSQAIRNETVCGGRTCTITVSGMTRPYVTSAWRSLFLDSNFDKVQSGFREFSGGIISSYIGWRNSNSQPPQRIMGTRGKYSASEIYYAYERNRNLGAAEAIAYGEKSIGTPATGSWAGWMHGVDLRTNGALRGNAIVEYNGMTNKVDVGFLNIRDLGRIYREDLSTDLNLIPRDDNFETLGEIVYSNLILNTEKRAFISLNNTPTMSPARENTRR